VIKHILVPATGLGFDANLLADAFKLASPFSAHVDVLHVRWEPRLDLPFYGEGFPVQMLDSVIREAEQSAQAASLAARNMFEKVSAAASVPVTASSSEDGPVTAEWREIAGPAARIIVPKPAQPI
jgi:hypothetical protein